MVPAAVDDVRDLLVRLAERSPDVLYRYRLGDDPGFEYISPAIEALTGYTPEEYYADPGLALRSIHPDDREWARTAIGSPPEYAGRATVRLIRKDGEVVWVERSSRVVTDAAGTPVAVEGVSRDISDRVQVEKEFRGREDTVRALFEETGLPMVLLDDDRRYVEGNPAACELFGVARERFAGHRLDDFTPPEDGVRLDELWTAFRDRGALSGDYRLLRPDGTIREIDLTATSNVRPGLHLAVLSDVTERRHLMELVQSQKMEAVGRLAGGVAHDFNNQLAAIRLYCDLLLSHADDPHRVRSEVEGITRVAELASQLTAQLLALGRKQVMESRILDVNAVVARAEQMLRRLLGTVVLETELGPNLAPVQADPAQLERVIVNLVLNARDAMPGGGTITILTARVEREGEPSVLLQVSDTGVGMDESTRARLFEPFFTTKAPGEGTGLGLATVYGVVTQSGGTIEVESEPGEGATFRVHLPPSEAEVDAGRIDEDVHAPAGRGETLLLVDDDDAVRAVTAEVLAHAGYRVLAAAHGVGALELAEELEGQLDVVVTDLRMPAMGGAELTARLRERFADLRVVFMSGDSQADAVVATHPDGLAAFVQKPFSSEELAQAIRAVLDFAP